MELYPIGTVFKIKEHNMIILGYKELMDGNHFKFCYIISIYPLGVRKKEDVRLLEIDKVEDVVFLGYMGNKSYEQYIKEKKELYDSLEKTTPDEVREVFGEMEKNLQKLMRSEEG
ncbi:MAG: DUF4176 domain-containing protein [Clostridium sp.]|nr:DUF4176 domain-containing protein [Clostridium sp.]